MNRQSDFFKEFTDLEQPYCSIKVHWRVKFCEIQKDKIVLLSHQVNKAFCCTKGLYEMKNYERYWYHIFCAYNYADVIENCP